MRYRSNRWIARLLLAVMAFAQASVAFADCPSDRGRLSHVLAADAMATCESVAVALTEYGPQYANQCLAHCTADLQIPIVPVAIVRSAADAPVLFLARVERSAVRPAGLQGPAPGTPPPRILLHSFQI